MKKIILIGLFVITLMLVLGAGKKFYLSQYEEVCSQYQMNVTAERHCMCNSTWQYLIMCFSECCNCPESGKVYYYTHNYIPTDNCVEYKLIRKTNVTPFIYLFDWCEVYPNSVTENCTNKTK